jgi:hypothetical protein
MGRKKAYRLCRKLNSAIDELVMINPAGGHQGVADSFGLITKIINGLIASGSIIIDRLQGETAQQHRANNNQKTGFQPHCALQIYR